jgi:hypothetical protein
MRCACLVLIAGCGFTSQPGPTEPDPVEDPSGGSGSGSAASCDVADPQIKLCVRFGGARMAEDLAVPPHAVAEATGIALISGLDLIPAGGFAPASRLRFAESRDFDVADLTLELSMSPQAVPAKNRAQSLIDNNTQYALRYDSDQAVRCSIGAMEVVSDTKVDVGTRHHVACTYSAASRQLRVHVDGEPSGCREINSIPQGGMDGIAIGAHYAASKYSDNFVGSLDGVHVYGRAMPPTELCARFGIADCDPASSGSGLADPLGPR